MSVQKYFIRTPLRILMAFPAMFLFANAFATATVDSTVTIDFVCPTEVQIGDTVCVDVVVSNFVEVASVQFSFTFDPFVLDYHTVQNDILPGGFFTHPGPEDVRYIWTEPSANTVDLPDGTALLQVCFRVTGQPGDTSVVTLDAGFDNEIGNGEAQPLPIIVNPCSIEVDPATSLGAFLTSCGADMGVGDGSFTIEVFGGTGPYTFSWVNVDDGSINGSGMLDNEGDMATESVPPGTYEITVMDSGGEEQVYTIEIDAIAFIYAITGVSPTCFNFTNGRISIEAAEGTPPYSVLWEHATNAQYAGSAFFNAGGSHVVNSLPGGEYYVTIVDGRGCLVTDTVTLTVSPFIIDATIADATCNGAADGSVEINLSGGNPDPPGAYEVSVSWSPGMFQTDIIATPPILDPGTYSITVTDQVVSCDTVFTFTVGSQTDISANITTQPTSCATLNDGEAEVTGITDGTTVGPYSFTLFDSTGAQVGNPVVDVTTVTFFGLAPGSYGVVIEEGPCISDTIPLSITSPEPINVELLEVRPTGCFVGAMDGRITVSASGGTVSGDYTYSWNGGTLSGSTINNLSGGMYFLTVTDDNMCSAQLNVNVGQASGPVITDIVAANLGCEVDSSTTLEVIYTEGTAPVTVIDWSTGDSTAIISSPPAGNVMVTIRDSFFCFDIASFTVPSGGTIVMDSVVLESPTCGGDSDGMITVHVSEGVEPYTYIWSTGDTTSFNLLAGLTAGTYSVTVMDSDTCAVVDTTVELMDVTPLGFAFSSIDSTSCATSCDGGVTLMPTDGIPGQPYEFLWESGLTESGLQSTPTDLCSGFQQVTITQDNLCFYVDSVLIPAPLPVGHDTVSLSHVSCYGAGDGSISLSGSGGRAGYTFDWEGLPSGASQNQLAAGTYMFTVTDSEMCTYTDSIEILQPDSLTVQIDSSGLVPVSCTSPDNAVITVMAQGGTPSYAYTWTDGVSTSAVASGLSAGTYAVTVTDNQGCTDTVSATLTGPEPVVGYFPPFENPVCAGGQTLITLDSATGGTGNYTFSINGGQQFPLDTAVAVGAGFYNIVVRDASGCTDTTSIALENPDPIEISVQPPNPIVDLGDSLRLQISVTNANGPLDSIGWSQNGPLSCYDCNSPFTFNITPTTYLVTIRDSAGCTSSAEVFVDVNDNRKVYIPNAFSPNFDGRNDAFMIFTGQGATSIPSVRIFDRWGELLVEEFNLPASRGGVSVWDGYYKNEPLQPGVYIYLVEVAFADNQVLLYRGDVTLLR